MFRRRFLGVGLVLAGFSRRAWAQPAGASQGFSPLTRPVKIPLESVATPWHTVPFVAEAVTPADGDKPGRRVILNGVLFRKAAGEDAAALSALCVTCPHEQCQVDIVTDEARLAKMTKGEAKNPLFQCGCHFSVFDAMDDGAWVSGVAYRGLFRFRVGSVSDGAVQINDVEEEALSVV
jgi:Rieske Fe-S protein